MSRRPGSSRMAVAGPEGISGPRTASNGRSGQPGAVRARLRRIRWPGFLYWRLVAADDPVTLMFKHEEE